MTDIKEKLPHEKTLDDITKKADMLNMYTSTLSLRAEDVIMTTKQKLIDSKGIDYLTTNKGHEEYGELGAQKAQELVLDEFKLDKNKFNDEELSDIVKMMYKTNKKTLTEFAREYGPKMHHGLFLENYLDKHINKLTQSTFKNHMNKYDPTHNPAIIDHIFEGKHTDYFKPELLDEIKSDRLKPEMWIAIQAWNKGKQPLGLDYLRQSDTWSMYLKEEHKESGNLKKYSSTNILKTE
jgi:hypothetical protein